MSYVEFIDTIIEFLVSTQWLGVLAFMMQFFFPIPNHLGHLVEGKDFNEVLSLGSKQ